MSDTSDQDEPQNTAAEGSTDQLEDEEPRRKKARQDPGPRKFIKLTEQQEIDMKKYLLKEPGLYDRSTQLWADPAKKEQEWQKLANQLKLARPDLNTWYKTLRKDVGKLRKKLRTSGTEGWTYNGRRRWERWSFLESHISEVTPKSSTQSLQEPPGEASHNNLHELSYLHTIKIDPDESRASNDDQWLYDPNFHPPAPESAADTAPVPVLTPDRPRCGTCGQTASVGGLGQMDTNAVTAIIQNSQEQTRGILQFLRDQAPEKHDPFMQQRVDFGRYVSSTLNILPVDLYNRASQDINDIISAALKDFGKRN